MSKYAEQLRLLGFKRWYERRLVHAHLYLTLCVIALVMLSATLEGLSMSGPTKDLISDAALLFASGGIAIWAWKKYQRHMMMANELAHYATCPRCQVYGALTFPTLTQGKIGLHCKKCENGWEHETNVFAV